jgi:hypothetical protein
VTRKIGIEEKKKGACSKTKISDIDQPSTSGTLFRKNKKLSSSSPEETDSLELNDSSDNDLPQESLQNTKEDAVCMFWSEYFSNDNRGEVRIQCLLCCKWAHEICSGGDSKHFVCDFCE